MFDGRGYPMIALWCQRPHTQKMRDGTRFTRRDAIVAGGEWRIMNTRMERLLPLRLAWPGFAINTVFYAAVLWMLFAVPMALRKMRGGRRIKRGWCPKCAYDLRGRAPQGAVCPECGAGVTLSTA
jgi:hypothetical protein